MGDKTNTRSIFTVPIKACIFIIKDISCYVLHYESNMFSAQARKWRSQLQLFQSNGILSSDHAYKQVLIKMLHRNGKKKPRRNHVLHFMLQSLFQNTVPLKATVACLSVIISTEISINVLTDTQLDIHITNTLLPLKLRYSVQLKISKTRTCSRPAEARGYLLQWVLTKPTTFKPEGMTDL